jgi:histidinol phosphatase-like PHP family hydrolase
LLLTRKRYLPRSWSAFHRTGIARRGIEQIEEQHHEADRLNKKFGKDFRILKGIESDILADGSLDYPNEVLDRFDFVVASIHGRFKLDRMAQTKRLLRAISNPHTTIFGHMTERRPRTAVNAAVEQWKRLPRGRA